MPRAPKLRWAAFMVLAIAGLSGCGLVQGKDAAAPYSRGFQLGQKDGAGHSISYDYHKNGAYRTREEIAEFRRGYLDGLRDAYRSDRPRDEPDGVR